VTYVRFRSRESIQGRGSQSITAGICIKLPAQPPDVLSLAIPDRQHSTQEKQTA
jgi:hypothetical protein